MDEDNTANATPVPDKAGDPNAVKAPDPKTAAPNAPASGAGNSVAAAVRVAGVFILEEDPAKEKDQFDLRPNPDRTGPIPEDQRNVSREVYGALNTLKLLKDRGIFKKNAADYNEFIKRIKQVAKAGCTEPNVDTALALAALADIRADVVRRRGRPVAFRYLLILALWGAGGILVGGAVLLLGHRWTELSGFGFLIMGSMIGAWLSVAASRWEIAFEGLQDFLDARYEPAVRLLFVAVLACVVGLFLQLGVFNFKIGSADLMKFADNPLWAVALGVVAGIGERALSMQVLARSKEVLTIGAN